MTLAYTDITRTVWGDKRAALVTVTFDNSYPTGGEAVAASDVGLTAIDHVIAAPLVSVDNDVYWDGPNSKLFVTVRSTGVEVANAVSLATLTARLLVIGK